MNLERLIDEYRHVRASEAWKKYEEIILKERGRVAESLESDPLEKIVRHQGRIEGIDYVLSLHRDNTFALKAQEEDKSQTKED